MIDKTITITCDGRGCNAELLLDLDDGSPFTDDQTKIENFLTSKAWTWNYDGEFCKNCTTKRKANGRPE